MNELENEKFMRMAIQLSEVNVQNGEGGPFGAVIVKNGQVVARSAARIFAMILQALAHGGCDDLTAVTIDIRLDARRRCRNRRGQ